MRTAITGATGLLGANLAIELLRTGHTVRATRRASSDVSHLEGMAIEWMDAGLDSPDRLADAFRGADVVFHCAAQVGVTRRATAAMSAANVDGTRHVLDAVKVAGARRLVHCSTVACVALSSEGTPSGEDAEYNFDVRGMADGYGRTKREAERLVQEAAQAGLDAVIASPCYMFGPYDVRPSSGQLIVDVVRGKVPGLTRGKNNFVDVRDVARGMILVAERGRTGERYILGDANWATRPARSTMRSGMPSAGSANAVCSHGPTRTHVACAHSPWSALQHEGNGRLAGLAVTRG